MKKNILNILYILIVCLLAWSCNQKISDDSFAASAYETVDATASLSKAKTNDVESNIAEVSRKLIKEGQIEFESSNMAESKRKILDAVTKYQGYVSSDAESKYYERFNNSITVRIPSKNFDAFLADATSGVKQFDNKNIQVRDVTEEFLDVEARLKTKKELELKYLELSKRANSVSDLLEIEQQCNTLRSDIESIEGRLKYLSNQVAFSTLTITIYEKIPGRSDFSGKLIVGVSEGWDSFVHFIIWLVSIWPFLILIAGILVVFVKWRSNRRKKKALKS